MADGQTPAKVAQPDDWQDVQQPNDWQDADVPSDTRAPMVLMPNTWSDVASGFPGFAKQVGHAAGQNLSDAWQGIKTTAKENLNQLQEDPSRIVPMWFFGGLGGGLAAGAKAVATPISAAMHGNFSDAISSAAGGDPEAAKQYGAQGNAGGEFWEMMGKPLALLATTKALGMTGGALAEGADAGKNLARLKVMRNLMRDTSTVASADWSQAQLAQQALQDAAREAYGTGAAGEKALGKALPSRDRPINPKGLLDVLSGAPIKDRVGTGNAELMRLSNRAVEIAGTPADRINTMFGYMDGTASADAIKHSLLRQAEEAQQNGLTSYSNALKQRAASMDGKKTLGQIYDVKKAANKLSGVIKNTQESIDLMDSWSALAGAIRNEVYPIYERQVQSTMPGFSIAQAGRKEGAAIALRNGLEARLGRAQAMSDELHMSGHATTMASRGAPEHRIGMSIVTRTGQKVGVFPSEQGAFNLEGRNAIGPLSPNTVPESISGVTPPYFGPNPPQTKNLLPGRTMQFQIQGVPPLSTTTGQIAQSAAQTPGHAFESPSFMTASAPTRTATIGGTGRIVPGAEGGMGADISTARVPEAQGEFIHGQGTLITSDPKIAQNTLERLQQMAKSGNYPTKQMAQIQKAITSLKMQLAAYQKGIGKAAITHVPPTAKYTPRVSGKIPVGHPLRQAAPVAVTDWEREHAKQ